MKNDFHDELREYSRLCSKSLSDDTELCQQVEHELFDHLEDAFEEERKNASEEQALKSTMRRFGNPEELSSQLAESNSKRLSRHAHIRNAVRWLALPVLIIGVFLCIDVRSIISSVILLKWTSELFDMERRDVHMDLGLKTRTLSDDEQRLFSYYFDNLSGEGRIEILSRLYASNREDTMICALYAQELSHYNFSVPEQLPEILANGRRIDPGNSLYDYLECNMLILESCALPKMAESPEDDAIKDRAKLDEAMAIYGRALHKGIVRNYSVELQDRIRGMLKIHEDLLGGLHLIDVVAREKLYLQVVGTNIARGVVLYCDILHKEGNDAKALEFLRTWRVFIPQFVEREGACMLDILAGIKRMKFFLKCAKRLDMADEIAALQAGADMDKEMQDTIHGHTKKYLRAGGLLSGIVPPYSVEGDNIAEWSIERKLEVATFDSMTIGLSCLVLLVTIVLFAIHAFFLRIGGRRPFLFILPKTAYARLLLKGILLPALIYLAMVFYTAGKGGLGFLLQGLPCAFLCLVWPLYYAAYCHRLLTGWMHSIGADNHDTFRASSSLNMLCLLVVLLLAIGGILRPISNWRQRHYARMETLVIPRNGVETYEKRVIRKWQKHLQNLCK